jgi:hypothetical protein
MVAKKIKAMFIFEMMGKPPEYIKEELDKHLKNLENEDVVILSKKIHECKPVQNDIPEMKGLFTTFAEVELEVSNINLLFGITFRLLPSHVEIIEPAELYLKNFDLGAIITDLTVKLHKYDEIAKVLMMDRDNLARELNNIRGNLIRNVRVEEIKKEEVKLPKKGKKKK